MTNCPEYIIVFLIHFLAHNEKFPSENCQDEYTYAEFCRYDRSVLSQDLFLQKLTTIYSHVLIFYCLHCLSFLAAHYLPSCELWFIWTVLMEIRLMQIILYHFCWEFFVPLRRPMMLLTSNVLQYVLSTVL